MKITVQIAVIFQLNLILFWNTKQGLFNIFSFTVHTYNIVLEFDRNS